MRSTLWAIWLLVPDPFFKLIDVNEFIERKQHLAKICQRQGLRGIFRKLPVTLTPSYGLLDQK